MPMKRLALLLALLSAPAWAEVGSQPKRMSLVPPHGPCFAEVKVVNTVGFYNETETLDTDQGPVSIEYETVGGHNANDHDLVRVVGLPDGVLARPMNIDLPDGDEGFICLLEWIGG